MKTTIGILHWAPRVICILAILFISMLALDAFNPELSLLQQIEGFLIHLIPTYVLVALLILAWKREMIGGILFTLIGLGFTPLIYSHNYHMNQSVGMSLGIVMMVTFPFVVVGALFIASNLMKRKNHDNAQLT